MLTVDSGSLEADEIENRSENKFVEKVLVALMKGDVLAPTASILPEVIFNSTTCRSVLLSIGEDVRKFMSASPLIVSKLVDLNSIVILELIEVDEVSFTELIASAETWETAVDMFADAVVVVLDAGAPEVDVVSIKILL